VTTGTLCELTQVDTWLSAPAGQLSRVAGDERLAEIGARPARRWEFEGLDVLAALVNAGAGIALLPAGVVQDYPLVTALPLKPRMHRRVLALTRSTTQQDPAIAICLRAAQQALALLR
jgi:DNA-binding transcriptional LysR family regulator